MKVHTNVPLAPRTTLGAGGRARYYVDIETRADVREAVSFAKEKAVPILVLGDGSNILIHDEGFPGLVVRPRTRTIQKIRHANGSVQLIIDAGVVWDDIVAHSVQEKWWGIENLSHIPGLVGAAPIQNIGCYGQEVADTLMWVDAYDMHAERVVRFDKEQCRFGYRSSIFKERPNRYVVLRVALLLKSAGKPNLSYEQLRTRVEDTGRPLTLAAIRSALFSIRSEKDMVPGAVRSAGSFFKNPLISRAHYAKLQKRYPGVPGFSAGAVGEVKVPAAWLIDKACGLRGQRRGNVCVSDKQAAAIVNCGGASAREIKNFSEYVARCVRRATNVQLEPEVRCIGF